MPNIRHVNIAGVVFGPSKPFALIAGPCVIETEKSTLNHAGKLKNFVRRPASRLFLSPAMIKPTGRHWVLSGARALKRGLEF